MVTIGRVVTLTEFTDPASTTPTSTMIAGLMVTTPPVAATVNDPGAAGTANAGTVNDRRVAGTAHPGTLNDPGAAGTANAGTVSDPGAAGTVNDSSRLGTHRVDDAPGVATLSRALAATSHQADHRPAGRTIMCPTGLTARRRTTVLNGRRRSSPPAVRGEAEAGSARSRRRRFLLSAPWIWG